MTFFLLACLMLASLPLLYLLSVFQTLGAICKVLTYVYYLCQGDIEVKGRGEVDRWT